MSAKNQGYKLPEARAADKNLDLKHLDALINTLPHGALEERQRWLWTIVVALNETGEFTGLLLDCWRPRNQPMHS